MAIYKNKDIDVSVNVDSIDKGNIKANFYTEDKGTSSIKIYLNWNKNRINLNSINMQPQLDLFHSDGSIFMDEPLNIIYAENGLVQYKISDNVIKHVGKVNAKLFLKNDTQSVHVADFGFNIKDSGVTDAVDKEITVNLVDDSVRRIIQENAIELLGDGFKDDVSVELKNYVNDNAETFKGPKGDEGKQGQRGPQGVKGDTGEQGLQGPRGLQGIKGERGLRGEQGLKGDKGLQGPTGLKGDIGPKGDKGDTGIQGPKGEPLKYSDLTTQQKEELKSNITDQAITDFVLEDGSIDTVKLSFVKPKKNIFNYKKVIDGVTLNTTDGTTKSDVSWSNTTEFMPVEINTTYIASSKFTNFCLYDADKTFIKSYTRSSSTIPTIIETTNNTAFVRGTIYDADLNVAQIEKGTNETSYEPYELILKQESLEEKPIQISQLPKISVKDTTLGVNVSKNLFNPNTFKSDTGLNTSGAVVYNNSNHTSDFIEVLPNTSYVLSSVVVIAWYDINKNPISTVNGSGIKTSPTNAKYLKVMFKKENINIVMVAAGNTYIPYEPYREVIDRKYLDLPSSGNHDVGQAGIGYTTSFNQSDLALAEQNAYNLVPNVPEPLNIPTYEGSGAATHPSVLYFKDGWNGYKFWMAFTPYPNSNNKFENPSIVASNDNITWDVPATNPIAPLLPENTYQSDPCIFMNGDKMEMWYRVSTINPAGGYYPTEMYRMTTTDGVNWTAREKMFDGSTFGDEFLSQTIRFKDGKYMMWLVFKDKTTNALPVLMYAESTDGKSWEKRILNVTLTDNAYTFWHGDVIENPNGGYDFIVMCKSDTKKWATFYTYSHDNINWTTPVMIIKSSYPSNKYWDSKHLYRPALVYVDNQYYVYYTTPSNIGLTKGKTLLTLGTDNNNKMKILPEIVKAEHYIMALNALPATATFDKYPKNSITTMPVWSSTDAGWAELSGTVKTENLLNESNKAIQYFYPTSKSAYYYVRNATSTGWSGWYKYVGSSI